MGKKKKLSKAALKEVRAIREDLKVKSDAAYRVWTELNSDFRTYDQVLKDHGIVIKDEVEKGKAEATKGSAATLRDAIAKILKESGQTKASIIREKLKRDKVAFRPAYFWRVLGRMEGKGRVKRVGPGMYELVNGTS